MFTIFFPTASVCCFMLVGGVGLFFSVFCGGVNGAICFTLRNNIGNSSESEQKQLKLPDVKPKQLAEGAKMLNGTKGNSGVFP